MQSLVRQGGLTPVFEQMLDRARVVAQNASLAHAIAIALDDEDATSDHWLGRGFDGCLRSTDIKASASQMKDLDQLGDPLMQLAPGSRVTHCRRHERGGEYRVELADIVAETALS